MRPHEVGASLGFCVGPEWSSQPGRLSTENGTMRRYRYWLCGLAVLTATLSSAGAKDDAKSSANRAKRSAGLVRGWHAQLVKECNFTPEQTAALEETLRLHGQKSEQWRQKNRAKMMELRQALAEARKANDQARASALNNEMRALQKDMAKLTADRAKQVMAILTPAQKKTWDAARTYTRVLGRYRKANISDQQRRKIKELCGPLAEKLAPLNPRDKKGRREISLLRSAVFARIYAEILTAGQKETVELAKLYPKVLRPCRGADLTKEQRQTIKEQCPAVAKQLAAMDPADKKGRGNVVKEFHRRIQSEILTEEQRQKMKSQSRDARQKRRGGGRGKSTPNAGAR